MFLRRQQLETNKIRLLLQNKSVKTCADTILEAIRDGGDPNTQDKDGNTVLHRFLMDSVKESIINELITDRHANLSIPNKALKTPLQTLLQRNCTIHEAMVLVRGGANPNIKDDLGCTLLMRFLISRASLKLIHELLYKHNANVNLADDDGRTALQYAIENAMFEEGIELIDAGADAKEKDKYGLTLYAKMQQFQAPSHLLQKLDEILLAKQKIQTLHLPKTESFSYVSVSRWYKPPTQKELKAQESLRKENEERQEKMEAVYDQIFKL